MPDEIGAGVVTVTAGTAAMVNVVEAALLVLPAVSTWVAVTVWLPIVKIDAHDHAPLAATTAVHTMVLPCFTVTVAPASPVPLMLGLGATVEPLIGAEITGAFTTVSLVPVALPVPVPAILVCDATTVSAPSSKLLRLTVVA